MDKSRNGAGSTPPVPSLVVLNGVTYQATLMRVTTRDEKGRPKGLLAVYEDRPSVHEVKECILVFVREEDRREV